MSLTPKCVKNVSGKDPLTQYLYNFWMMYGKQLRDIMSPKQTMRHDSRPLSTYWTKF